MKRGLEKLWPVMVGSTVYNYNDGSERAELYKRTKERTLLTLKFRLLSMFITNQFLSLRFIAFLTFSSW